MGDWPLLVYFYISAVSPQVNYFMVSNQGTVQDSDDIWCRLSGKYDWPSDKVRIDKPSTTIIKKNLER
jgi:hypothetical protein